MASQEIKRLPRRSKLQCDPPASAGLQSHEYLTQIRDLRGQIGPTVFAQSNEGASEDVRMARAQWCAVGKIASAAVCGLLLAACGAAQPGLTTGGPDERAVVTLSAKEARALQKGMRIYLESVQGIIDGANRNDMRQVAKSAERSGTGMVSGLSLTDALALPPEFVGMALDTHQKFDELASSARQRAGKRQVMQQLDAILVNCTACHAAFRLGR